MEPSLYHDNVTQARLACVISKTSSVAWQPRTKSAVETIFNKESLAEDWMNDTYFVTGLDLMNGSLFYADADVSKPVPYSLTKLMPWKSGYPHLDDPWKRCVLIHMGELVNAFCDDEGER